MDTFITISFIIFVTILLFNVYEFAKVGKMIERGFQRMEDGFRRQEENHKLLVKTIKRDHEAIVEVLKEINLTLRKSKRK